MRFTAKQARAFAAVGVLSAALLVPASAFGQQAPQVSSGSEEEVIATTTLVPDVTVPPDVRGLNVTPEVREVGATTTTTTSTPVTAGLAQLQPEAQAGRAQPEVLAAPAAQPETLAAPAAQPEVLAEAVDNAGLAITGADIVGLVVLAALLVGGGTALLATRRRSYRS